MDRHKKLFKAKTDVTDMRSTRNNLTVELRQNKRCDLIQQKRMMVHQDDSTEEKDSFREEGKQLLNSGQGYELIQNCFCDDEVKRLHALKIIRVLLSDRTHRPIDALLELNVLPALIENIKIQQKPDLQYEALWSITNIASGTSPQTRSVVDAGAVEWLVFCLKNSSEKIIEQAAWALSNVIGDGPELRDVVLQYGYMDACCQLISSAKSEAILANIAWSLINVCRSKEFPLQENIATVVVEMFSRLLSTGYFSVISDTLWGLSYLVDSSISNADLVFKSNVLSVILQYLDSTNNKAKLGVIRSLGNLAAGTDEHTGYVCSLGIMNYVEQLMKSDDTKVIQEFMWMVSNIAAGTKEQMRLILKTNMPLYINEILKQGLLFQKKEALWIISNILHNGETEDAYHVYQSGIMDGLICVLRSDQSDCIKHSLECFIALFKLCPNYLGDMVNSFEGYGGMDVIDELENTENQYIFKLLQILKTQYLITYTGDSDTLVDFDVQDSLGSDFNL